MGTDAITPAEPLLICRSLSTGGVIFNMDTDVTGAVVRYYPNTLPDGAIVLDCLGVFGTMALFRSPRFDHLLGRAKATPGLLSRWCISLSLSAYCTPARRLRLMW